MYTSRGLKLHTLTFQWSVGFSIFTFSSFLQILTCYDKMIRKEVDTISCSKLNFFQFPLIVQTFCPHNYPQLTWHFQRSSDACSKIPRQGCFQHTLFHTFLSQSRLLTVVIIQSTGSAGHPLMEVHEEIKSLKSLICNHVCRQTQSNSTNMP